MKNKKNKTKNEEIFDKNLEVLSDENDMISEEDYYLADALAQDGQDIEEYAIWFTRHYQKKRLKV